MPLTFAQANSGVWEAPVNFTDVDCVPTGVLPGNVITHSNSNICQAPFSTTRFYRTTFNMDFSAGVCSATLAVRADNGFRVYIDGNVVPCGAILGDGGETNCAIAANVVGDKHFILYNLNIAAFLNLQSLNHTLIIEVINCDYQTWLSARADFTPTINLNSSFVWSLTGSSLGGPMSLSLTPQNPNYTSHHWLVEVASSSSGPFTIIYNSRTDSKYRPGSTGTTTVQNIPRSSFIRVTHTVSFLCGSASTTIIIPTAEFQAGNESYLSVESDGETTYTDLTSSASPFSKSIVSQENAGVQKEEYHDTEISIFPNPFSDRFRINTNGLEQYSMHIFDSMGRMVLEKSSDETNTQEFEVDLSGFANGIYRVSILDKSGNLIESKNVLKLN